MFVPIPTPHSFIRPEFHLSTKNCIKLETYVFKYIDERNGSQGPIKWQVELHPKKNTHPNHGQLSFGRHI